MNIIMHTMHYTGEALREITKESNGHKMDDSLPATIQFVERLSHLTPEEKKLYMEMMGK